MDIFTIFFLDLAFVFVAIMQVDGLPGTRFFTPPEVAADSHSSFHGLKFISISCDKELFKSIT